MLEHVAHSDWLYFWTWVSFRLPCIFPFIYTSPPPPLSSFLLFHPCWFLRESSLPFFHQFVDFVAFEAFNYSRRHTRKFSFSLYHLIFIYYLLLILLFITFDVVVRRLGWCFPFWRLGEVLRLMTWTKNFIIARSLADWRLFTRCFTRHLTTYKWQIHSKNLSWRPHYGVNQLE